MRDDFVNLDRYLQNLVSDTLHEACQRTANSKRLICLPRRQVRLLGCVAAVMICQHLRGALAH